MKRLGCCTLCDKEVFEIKERFTGGDVDGLAKTLGRPYEEARRITLVLIDGKHMALTFCGDCEVMPETLPEIHRKARLAWAFEATNATREQLKGEPLDLAGQWRYGAHQILQTNIIPIGVLHEESWLSAMAREVAR